MDNIRDFYLQKVSGYELMLKSISREMTGLSFARLAAFVLFITTPFIFKGLLIAGIGLSLIFLIVFLILVKKHIEKGLKKKYCENLIKINKEELNAIDHDFSGFCSGEEFIDPNHVNSFDLDLFGKGSLFQYLSRTVTLNGRAQLACLLNEPLECPEKITARQELIGELATMVEWRQSFMANGMLYSEDFSESKLFEKWGEEEFSLKTINILPLLMILLPLFSVASVIYWLITGNFTYFILSGLLQFGLWMVEKKNTAIIYHQFGKRVKILKKYASLFQMIETVKWKSTEGKAIIDELYRYGIPSENIGKLSRIVAAFDHR
ncbi:MAG: hypothetical protein JW833_15320, partial [Prolixibacteraceae bacterium]|nr:hypothetical protein [Prolixibacteraceae bacterium]